MWERRNKTAEPIDLYYYLRQGIRKVAAKMQDELVVHCVIVRP